MADEVPETTERMELMPQRRRTPVGMTQLVLAMFDLAAGTMLTIELLSTDAVTARRPVLLAGALGLMLLLAVIHLVIFRLGLKLSKGVSPRPKLPECIG